MTIFKKSLIALASAGAILTAMPETNIVTSAEAQSRQSLKYSILVYTSDIRKAGTGANVYATLYGTHGVSEKKLLDKSGVVDFERDEVNFFQLSTSSYLGDIVSIKLEHDNTGTGAGWHVGKVAILEPGTFGKDFDWNKLADDNLDDEYKDAALVRYISGKTRTPVVLEGLSLYNFDAWIADDEHPNHGEKSPNLTEDRIDYDKFLVDLSKDFKEGPGAWKKVCQGIAECSADVTTGAVNGLASSESRSYEYWAALTLGIEKKVALPKIGKATVSSSLEVGASHTINNETSKSSDRSIEFSCGGVVDLGEANKDALWQWSTNANFLGSEIEFAKCIFVCTEGVQPPSFDADSPLALGTCSANQRTTQAQPAQAKAPTEFRHTRRAALSGYNDRSFSNYSVDQCKSACVNETGFYCKSFDYNTTNGRCDLSKSDTSGNLSLKTDYPGHPYDHYQRIGN